MRPATSGLTFDLCLPGRRVVDLGAAHMSTRVTCDLRYSEVLGGMRNGLGAHSQG